MSEALVWFERKFEFDFPIEHYPNICIRLQGAPARLEDMVRGVPRSAMVAKVAGHWSAQEHAGHLLDMEPLWLARVEDFLREGSALTPADLTNQKTHEANHDARELGEILAEFRAARLGLVDRLDRLQAEEVSRTLVHPRLNQPMRLIDHVYFVAEHDDHHLAAISRLIC